MIHIDKIKAKMEESIVNCAIEHYEWFEKKKEESHQSFLLSIIEELKKYKRPRDH